MPESVKVFVSHSHADDAFTDRLVADLRAAGADVWVDTAEIRHDDFIRKINDGMAGRQWLVLVLTPDALRSPWVQAEVNAALNRKMQGFMQGVIPLLARPCDPSDIPPMWSALHRYDATLDYQTALTGLFVALDLPAPARPTAWTPASFPGLHLAAARRVAADGRGDHRTIGEAVAAAKPGERIEIQPGTYLETLMVDKSLELMGLGRSGDVVIEGKGAHVIRTMAPRVLLSNLTVRYLESALYSNAVWATEGTLFVEGCDISGKGTSIDLAGAEGSVRRTRIHDCSGYAVFVGNESRALLEDNDISGSANSYGAVAIVGDGSLTLYRNRITGNKGSAVLIGSQSTCIAEDNDLRDNAGGSWSIAADAGKVDRARNLE